MIAGMITLVYIGFRSQILLLKIVFRHTSLPICNNYNKFWKKVNLFYSSALLEEQHDLETIF